MTRTTTFREAWLQFSVLFTELIRLLLFPLFEWGLRLLTAWRFRWSYASAALVFASVGFGIAEANGRAVQQTYFELRTVRLIYRLEVLAFADRQRREAHTALGGPE